MPVIVWEIDPDVVNRMPSNDGANLIRYALNHEKKLATKCVEVGHLLKVAALGYVPLQLCGRKTHIQHIKVE